MRLRKTLVVYMLPVMIIPMLLLGYAAYYYSQKFYQQELFVQHQKQLFQSKTKWLLQLHRYQDSLMLFSQQSFVNRYLDGEQSAESEVISAMQKFSVQHPDMLSVKFVRLNGDIPLRLPQLSSVEKPHFGRQYFSSLQSMVGEQSFFLSTNPVSSELSFFIAQKLYHQSDSSHSIKKVWGYLVFVLQPSIFEQAIEELNGELMTPLIITQSANIAFAENKALIGSVFGPANYQHLQQSINSQSYTQTLLLGKTRYVSGMELEGHYQLLLGVDSELLWQHQGFKPLYIALFSLLSIVGLPAFFYIVIARFVLAPVQKLTHAKTTVGRGDLSVLLPVYKQDEMGDMFAAFNVMVRQLRVYRERERAYQQQLEEKVVSRTQDLATANKNLEEANVQLMQSRLMAEQASQLKSAFLANMSHEIRTPLTAILGFSEQAILELDRELQHDYLQRVRSSGSHLLALINDVLDLSKIEADKLELRPEPCALKPLLDDVFHLMQQQGEVKGLRVVLDLAFPLPDFVVVDSVRFKQVLLNLASNAIKFTQEGKVVLGVRYLTPQEQLCIRVQDTGVGMTEPEVARLFQPFMQADASVSRVFGGTGLGLCISKNLMKQMGGDIYVESVKGVGSCFEMKMNCEHMHLRLVPEFVEAKPLPVAPLLADIPKHLRILIVEDNPDNQLLVQLMLKKIGLESDVVDNGYKAVERVLSDSYDLVLMDMQMPLMGGEEATRLLRHAGNQTPIIALTANVMAEDTASYLRAGCQAVLAKPIVHEEFVRLIQRVSSNAISSDYLHLQELLEQDPEIQRIKRDFQRQLPVICSQFQDFALKKQWDLLQYEAHSIKGSAGALGFPEVTQVMGQLEEALKAKRYEITHGLLRTLQSVIDEAVEGEILNVQ